MCTCTPSDLMQNREQIAADIQKFKSFALSKQVHDSRATPHEPISELTQVSGGVVWIGVAVVGHAKHEQNHAPQAVELVAWCELDGAVARCFSEPD